MKKKNPRGEGAKKIIEKTSSSELSPRPPIFTPIDENILLLKRFD